MTTYVRLWQWNRRGAPWWGGWRNAEKHTGNVNAWGIARYTYRCHRSRSGPRRRNRRG